MSLELRFDVSDEDAGVRLDRVLVDWVETDDEIPPMSRAFLQRLIKNRQVLLNGVAASKSKMVRGGDQITLILREPETSEIVAQAMDLDVIYEDSDLIVVNKSAGMVVHPAPGHSDGTLVNALLHHCPDLGAIGGTIRPGIVHRLDKGTTGLIVVAKNARSMELMSRIFPNAEFARHTERLFKERLLRRGSFQPFMGGTPRTESNSLLFALAVSVRRRVTVASIKVAAAVMSRLT